MALSSTSRLARELTEFIHSRKFNNSQKRSLDRTMFILFNLMTERERNGYWNWMGNFLRANRPPLDGLRLAQKIGKSLRKTP